ncbi:RNA uridylyltransferase [Aureococcus anophagefferens]|nr:RNA uridylyltransferase [Aureococcus anophagefferens]
MGVESCEPVTVQLDALLRALQPSRQSEERRGAVFGFVDEVLRKHDLDLTIIHPVGSPADGSRSAGCSDDSSSLSSRTNSVSSVTDDFREARDEEDSWVMLANEALCRSALAKGRASPEAMDIRNVTLVNARTTVVNCLVLNIPVDVTANHVESVAAQLLLEETDRAVGQEHLFKRTVLLVKAWCRHESCRYGDGVTVLSSRTGHLSTHAINVMVACLFVDKHLGDLGAMHPIHMLARFLNVYASLDWTREKLTLLGDDDDVDDDTAAGRPAAPPSKMVVVADDDDDDELALAAAPDEPKEKNSPVSVGAPDLFRDAAKTPEPRDDPAAALALDALLDDAVAEEVWASALETFVSARDQFDAEEKHRCSLGDAAAAAMARSVSTKGDTSADDDDDAAAAVARRSAAGAGEEASRTPAAAKKAKGKKKASPPPPAAKKAPPPPPPKKEAAPKAAPKAAAPPPVKASPPPPAKKVVHVVSRHSSAIPRKVVDESDAAIRSARSGRRPWTRPRRERAIAKKAPKPRREAPPAPPPRPATWAEFAFPAEGDVLEFCELCVWLFECFVCMAGFANLQTFAIYPLYSTAFATALIKGVECFVIGKFAAAAGAGRRERDVAAAAAPDAVLGSHGSPKRNRKGSR